MLVGHFYALVLEQHRNLLQRHAAFQSFHGESVSEPVGMAPWDSGKNEAFLRVRCQSPSAVFEFEAPDQNNIQRARYNHHAVTVRVETKPEKGRQTFPFTVSGKRTTAESGADERNRAGAK
jgi:hypothetical protein